MKKTIVCLFIGNGKIEGAREAGVHQLRTKYSTLRRGNVYCLSHQTGAIECYQEAQIHRRGMREQEEATGQALQASLSFCSVADAIVRLSSPGIVAARMRTFEEM